MATLATNMIGTSHGTHGFGGGGHKCGGGMEGRAFSRPFSMSSEDGGLFPISTTGRKAKGCTLHLHYWLRWQMLMCTTKLQGGEIDERKIFGFGWQGSSLARVVDKFGNSPR